MTRHKEFFKQLYNYYSFSNFPGSDYDGTQLAKNRSW